MSQVSRQERRKGARAEPLWFGNLSHIRLVRGCRLGAFCDRRQELIKGARGKDSQLTFLGFPRTLQKNREGLTEIEQEISAAQAAIRAILNEWSRHSPLLSPKNPAFMKPGFQITLW